MKRALNLFYFDSFENSSCVDEMLTSWMLHSPLQVISDIASATVWNYLCLDFPLVDLDKTI
jgi:hypothetical protein